MPSVLQLGCRQYLDNQIVYNNMLEWGAERRLQLDAALGSRHNSIQRQAIAKSEFSLPAPIQRKSWPQFSVNIAGTDPAESDVSWVWPCYAQTV